MAATLTTVTLHSRLPSPHLHHRHHINIITTTITSSPPATSTRARLVSFTAPRPKGAYGYGITTKGAIGLCRITARGVFGLREDEEGAFGWLFYNHRGCLVEQDHDKSAFGVHRLGCAGFMVNSD
uniref:Uncharacterized protein n=1 Tax=Tanacetum cinerariifolium TaxID=118510 RepID=A0A6L2MQW8_TANCI|nr:hypothetical protein [Tanacetum cinerariifolium]